MLNSDQPVVPSTPTQSPAPQTVAPDSTTAHTTVPLHSFNQPQTASMNSSGTKGSMNSSNNKLFLFLALVVIVAGVATGAGINKLKKNGGEEGSASSTQNIPQVAGSDIKNGQIFGSSKADDFKDSAEGYLMVGGVNGEGTHRLLREGGPTQTVALTSSVTDLGKFEHMKIKVWGETNTSQKAGWLMDVGRVEVEDTNAQPPFTETTK